MRSWTCPSAAALFAAALFAAQSSCAPARTSYDALASAPLIRFVGRVDTSDPNAARFAWSGSGFVARFSGTSLSVRLGGGQEYTVVVDGVVRPKLVSTGGFDSVVTGLAHGVHEAHVYRRTEAHLGESSFLGLEVGAGELLAPSAPPERRLEIIGDSITCGYGNEGADHTCGFTASTENHYLTYGALAARALRSELSTVAWSGKGVVCNYGDEPDSCKDPLPAYYDRALPNRVTSRWDFSNFQPHAVVINLGSNDFSTELDPTRTQFVTAYVALLERVRKAYKDAVILCTVGPLLSGAELSKAREYIQAAVRTRAEAGDAKVRAFELAPTNAADGHGCDWHPSLRTHQVMAGALTAELRNALGWQR